MNKKQTSIHTSEHAHHEEDNCDGCQAERAENNKLVDFYQRITNIENKVAKIKDHVETQKELSASDKLKVDKIGTLLLKKPEEAIELIKKHDAKQMGYELASALIEREIKAKAENLKLQAIIEQLQRDKIKLQEQSKLAQQVKSQTLVSPPRNLQKQLEFNMKGPTRYSDVLDEVRRTNSIDSTYFSGKSQGKNRKETNTSYFADSELHKNYWESAEGRGDTNFSNFTVPINRVANRDSSQSSKYQGLNLWLYEFKTDKIEENPIKSLRRPSNKYQSRVEKKYKSKF